MLGIVFAALALCMVLGIPEIRTQAGETLEVPDSYSTIQAAIDAAIDGDTVLVADGTYTGSGNKDLDFDGKAITVKSENGPENCIIDCENSGRGFYFHSGETSSAKVEGFTIKNGDIGTGYGGGIRCYYSSPTITNCVITGNKAGGYGGGIDCWKSDPIISNCTITDNSADRGAGISCYYSGPAITNCLITGNQGELGAGVSCQWHSDATLTNCTIADNSATKYGGGVYSKKYSDVTLNNSILWGNSASWDGNQVFIYNINAPVTLNYCDFANGEDDIGGSNRLTENNCIHSDPEFVDAGNGDYHLQGYSPCIDAGDESLVPEGVDNDLDGNPYVAGADVDMGAYAFADKYNARPNAPGTDDIVYWNEYDAGGNPVFNPENPTPGFVRAKTTDDDPDDSFEFCQAQYACSTNFAPADIMWDSGKTALPAPLVQGEFWPVDFLPYSGEALPNAEPIYIRVRVWDNNGAVSLWSEGVEFELQEFDTDHYSSESLLAAWGAAPGTLDSPSDIYVPVYGSANVYYHVSGWMNRDYDDATVVTLIDMHTDTVLKGSLGEEDSNALVVAPYPEYDGEVVIDYWYWFDTAAEIEYDCQGEGVDEISVSVFFKEGFNQIPLPGSNEVVIAWTSSGQDPFSYPDPIMYDWLLDNGFDIVYQPNDPTEMNNQPLVSITIICTPEDKKLEFTVESTTYETSHQFSWVPVSQHVVSLERVQKEQDGTAYVFQSWTDGSTELVRAIATPAENTTYTATFAERYKLTTSTNPIGVGAVAPPGVTWHVMEAVVSLTASPSALFQNWTGPVANANQRSTTVTIDGPKTVTANFTGLQVEILSPDDGDKFGFIASSQYRGTTEISFKARITPQQHAANSSVRWILDISWEPSPQRETLTGQQKTFTTASEATHSEDYENEGGKLEVRADAIMDGVVVGTTTITCYVVGCGIPNATIQNRVQTLYQPANQFNPAQLNNINPQNWTQNICWGIVRKESSTMQFYNQRVANYPADVVRMPYVSDDDTNQIVGDNNDGSHVGLMQVGTTYARAWDWHQNTQDGVDNLHEKLRISYRKWARTVSPTNKQIPQLSGSRHEDDALAFYRWGTANRFLYWVWDDNAGQWVKSSNTSATGYADDVRNLASQ
jgi:hypothetical protein